MRRICRAPVRYSGAFRFFELSSAFVNPMAKKLYSMSRLCRAYGVSSDPWRRPPGGQGLCLCTPLEAQGPRPHYLQTSITQQGSFEVGVGPLPWKAWRIRLYGSGAIRRNPPMYGASGSGTTIVPSACW